MPANASKYRDGYKAPRRLCLRTKIKFFLVFIGFCFSIFFGITTVYVDYKRRRVHRSPWMRAIATCSNAVLIGAFPFAFSLSYRMMQRTLLDNQLALITAMAKQFIVFAVMVLTVVQRCRREDRFVLMTREYFDIDACYFDRQAWDEPLERRFDYMFFAKILSTIAQPVVIVIGTLATNRDIGCVEALLMFYYVIMHSAVHSVLFHYFFALWSAYQRFAVLNAGLEHLLLQLQARSGVGRSCVLAAAQLREVAAVHLRVTRLMLRYNASNKVPVAAMLLVHMINLIAFGFYSIIIADGSLNVTAGLLELVVGLIAYTLLSVDLYLFYSACGGIHDCYRRAAEILTEFRAIPHFSLELEQQCELFYSQLILNELTISIGGLLRLTKRTSVTMAAFILRNTLIMVQFDRENRFRELKEAHLLAHMQNLGLD